MHGLDENEVKEEHRGITEGYNDFKQPGYRGPAPPTAAAHRFEFRLYALDKTFEKLPKKVRLPTLSSLWLSICFCSSVCHWAPF